MPYNTPNLRGVLQISDVFPAHPGRCLVATEVAFTPSRFGPVCTGYFQMGLMSCSMLGIQLSIADRVVSGTDRHLTVQ
jgi:hypothetical protein